MAERDQWEDEHQRRQREAFLVRVKTIKDQLGQEQASALTVGLDGILAEAIWWVTTVAMPPCPKCGEANRPGAAPAITIVGKVYLCSVCGCEFLPVPPAA